MRLLFTSLLFGLLLGCSGGRPRDAAEPSSTAASVTLSDSLRLGLELPAEARLGQRVPIAIVAENRGTQPLTLYLRGQDIVFDLTVTRLSGDTVWQRLHGQMIPAIAQVKTLQPGESFTLRDEWDQRDNAGEPIAPGDYVVRGAILRDEPAPLETPQARMTVGAQQ